MQEIDNYFKDWIKVINKKHLIQIMGILTNMESKGVVILPHKKFVFKAFHLCNYSDLKVVILGQDPYPQLNVATGLAFANSSNTVKLSPSLEIIKENILRNEPNGYLDISLETWAKQGVLLLNSALTVEQNKIGSHTQLWEPFIKSLLINLSEINSGIIYILFGNQAKSFKQYIGKNNYIFECYHPAYYVRNNMLADYTVFEDSNKILKENHNTKINWYTKN